MQRACGELAVLLWLATGSVAHAAVPSARTPPEELPAPPFELPAPPVELPVAPGLPPAPALPAPPVESRAAPGAAIAPGPGAPAVELRLGAAPRSKPPLSGLRISGEVLAFGAFGVSGAFFGLFPGAWAADALQLGSDGVGYGALLGMTLAAPLGVYAVGSLGDETGSVGWTYLGAGAGLGIGAPLAYAIWDEDAAAAVLVVVGAVVAGSTVGFNHSREYRPGEGPDLERPLHDDAPEADDADDAEASLSIVPTLDVTPGLFSVGAAGRF